MKTSLSLKRSAVESSRTKKMCYGTESDRFEALKDADYKEGGSWQQFGEKEKTFWLLRQKKEKKESAKQEQKKKDERVTF